MKINHLATVCGLLVSLYSGMSQAALITTNTLAVTDDFSNFTGATSTNGPVTLNSGAIWSTSYAFSFIGNSTYALNTNGNWTTARNGFTGLNTVTGSMTYTLPSLTDYVGGFINYSTSATTTPLPHVIIEALDASSNVLESYNITDLSPISTTANDDGSFFGFSRSTADISAFRVSNAYVVLDDLTYNLSPVPVPAAAWLFGSGLLALIGMARRRKA